MDDFKLIKGIGPAIERRLHEVGIMTFAQLAALSPDGLATLIDSVGGVSSERIAKQDDRQGGGPSSDIYGERTASL